MTPFRPIYRAAELAWLAVFVIGIPLAAVVELVRWLCS